MSAFRRLRFFMFIVLLTAASSPASSAEPQVENAAGQPIPNQALHDELVAVRHGLVEAYNAKDFDKLLSYCHPNIAITWQNSEVSRGREALKAYYNKMMTGENRVVDDLKADPTVDDRSIIYGDDTAIAYGKMNDHFKLRDGRDLALDSRWSATLVKNDGQWQVAAFHASANVFDNQILWMGITKTAWWSGGIAAVVGLLLGWMLTLTLRKKAQA